MRIKLASLFFLLAVSGFAQEVPVPVEQEPYHKTAFKNAYVQAFRVKLEPGKTSLMHMHSRDDAAVRLSAATVASEMPGERPGPPESVVPGMVSARDNEAKPTIHKVRNIGTTLFDVIDVQVLSRPPGPAGDPVSKPAAENARLRVYKYELAPGERSVMHTHKRPYLMIAATDVTLLMISPDGQSMEHPVKAGDMHWVEAQITHALANRGSNKAILVEFELK